MKISIITACYNNADTIEDTLKSVTEQTYPNIEYIIIDGKSTDDTLKIVSKCSAKIAKIASEPDKGIYDALNKGIAAATGDVIGFLHADDVYAHSDAIKKVAKCFENQATDSLYGDLVYTSKDDLNKTVRTWISGEFRFSDLKKGWMPPHPTFFVTKKIYEKYGNFDTTFKIAADYDIVLRFLAVGKISTQYLPEVLIKMRTGGASNKSLKNIIQKSREDIRALRKNKVGGFGILFMKNVRKIPQFFKK